MVGEHLAAHLAWEVAGEQDVGLVPEVIDLLKLVHVDDARCRATRGGALKTLSSP